MDASVSNILTAYSRQLESAVATRYSQDLSGLHFYGTGRKTDGSKRIWRGGRATGHFYTKQATGDFMVEVLDPEAEDNRWLNVSLLNLGGYDNSDGTHVPDHVTDGRKKVYDLPQDLDKLIKDVEAGVGKGLDEIRKGISDKEVKLPPSKEHEGLFRDKPLPEAGEDPDSPIGAPIDLRTRIHRPNLDSKLPDAEGVVFKGKIAGKELTAIGVGWFDPSKNPKEYKQDTAAYTTWQHQDWMKSLHGNRHPAVTTSSSGFTANSVHPLDLYQFVGKAYVLGADGVWRSVATYPGGKEILKTEQEKFEDPAGPLAGYDQGEAAKVLKPLAGRSNVLRGVTEESKEESTSTPNTVEPGTPGKESDVLRDMAESLRASHKFIKDTLGDVKAPGKNEYDSAYHLAQSMARALPFGASDTLKVIDSLASGDAEKSSKDLSDYAENDLNVILAADKNHTHLANMLANLVGSIERAMISGSLKSLSNQLHMSLVWLSKELEETQRFLEGPQDISLKALQQAVMAIASSLPKWSRAPGNESIKDAVRETGKGFAGAKDRRDVRELLSRLLEKISSEASNKIKNPVRSKDWKDKLTELHSSSFIFGTLAEALKVVDRSLRAGTDPDFTPIFFDRKAVAVALARMPEEGATFTGSAADADGVEVTLDGAKFTGRTVNHFGYWYSEVRTNSQKEWIAVDSMEGEYLGPTGTKYNLTPDDKKRPATSTAVLSVAPRDMRAKLTELRRFLGLIDYMGSRKPLWEIPSQGTAPTLLRLHNALRTTRMDADLRPNDVSDLIKVLGKQEPWDMRTRSEFVDSLSDLSEKLISSLSDPNPGTSSLPEEVMKQEGHPARTHFSDPAQRAKYESRDELLKGLYNVSSALVKDFEGSHPYTHSHGAVGVKERTNKELGKDLRAPAVETATGTLDRFDH